MNEPKTEGKLVKVYVTDRPRSLGLFHVGPAVDGGSGTTKRAGFIGLVSHVGPCKCGDTSHTFPDWYSVTPCAYVKAFGWMITCRLPVWLAHALYWASGN